MCEIQTENCKAVTRPDFIGPPPLIDGEDPKVYQKLFDSFARAAEPADIFEMMTVCDAVDATWSASQMRRLKGLIYKITAPDAVAQLFLRIPAMNIVDPYPIHRRFAANEEQAIQEVKVALEHAGLSMDAIPAQTLLLNIEVFERLDRMIAAADARRNASLREIDRRRAKAPAQRLPVDLEDAQYEVLDVPTDEQKEAA